MNGISVCLSSEDLTFCHNLTDLMLSDDVAQHDEYADNSGGAGSKMQLLKIPNLQFYFCKDVC